QVKELNADTPWVARLRYAYADTLFDVGRRDEAREWFSRAVDADPDGLTDAADRLLDIDGIELEDDDEADDAELALAIAHDEVDERTEAERIAVRNARADELGDEDDDDLDDDELDDIDDDDDLEDDDLDQDDDDFDDDDEDDEF